MLPQIISDFITEAERKTLLDWSLRQRLYLRPNGPGRQFRQLDMLPNVPILCDVLREAIADRLGLAEDRLEPVFRNYLSIIDTGGAIHRHTDPAPAGFDHLRCNLFLSLPDSGGWPVVEDTAYAVKEGDLLYFTPNRHLHWCQPGGPGVRVILSFGFLVRENNNENQQA